MRFAIMASGSQGNAALVEHGNTLLLVDCGLSCRLLCSYMEILGVDPSDLTGILITHEHRDHVVGLKAMAQRTGLRPYMTRGTAHHLDLYNGDFQAINADAAIELSDGMRMLPYTIPHDAREPVHYQLAAGGAVLSFATDIGHSTGYLIDVLKRSSALVLESNYDDVMLEGNPRYPPSLKSRIRGGFGHLSNDEAAEVLAEVNHAGLGLVVAAHLSENNNHPELPEQLLSAAAERTGHMPTIEVCPQHSFFPWAEVAPAGRA